jgi:flagellin
MPTVATNTSANTAVRYLNKNSMNQASSIGKLSSGMRIQKASDDSAGLAVAQRLRSDVTTLGQNAINASHGLAVLNVADGALGNIGDILQRMKAIATSSISGALSATERGFLNTEFTALRDDITAIVGSTRFNNTVLLDGTYTAAVGTFLVGTNGAAGAAATDRISFALANVNATGLGINAQTVTSIANAETAIPLLDTAINTISTQRATVGSAQSRFNFRSDVIAVSNENLSAAMSAIQDVDLAAEQTKFVNYQTLTDAAIASLSQANQMNQRLVQLLR